VERIKVLKKEKTTIQIESEIAEAIHTDTAQMGTVNVAVISRKIVI
jgi:adenosylcobinamide amidohydrolase